MNIEQKLQKIYTKIGKVTVSDLASMIQDFEMLFLGISKMQVLVDIRTLNEVDKYEQTKSQNRSDFFEQIAVSRNYVLQKTITLADILELISKHDKSSSCVVALEGASVVFALGAERVVWLTKRFDDLKRQTPEMITFVYGLLFGS